MGLITSLCVTAPTLSGDVFHVPGEPRWEGLRDLRELGERVHSPQAWLFTTHSDLLHACGQSSGPWLWCYQLDRGQATCQVLSGTQ